MTKPSLAVAAISVTYLMLLGAGPAHAGNNAALAEAYFKAISGGNPDGIASFYAEDAEFHWIGGPLAGVYKGKDKIRGVWDKFGKAAGRINHEVVQLTESSDDKNATVTAWVKFTGEGEVPVKFTLAYKDGKIASETWQVDKTPVTAMAVQVAPPAAKPEDTKPTAAKPVEANVGNLFSAPAGKKTEAPVKAVREAANAEDQPAKPESKPAAKPETKPEDKPEQAAKVDAKDSNPVPPPAAKSAAAPAEPERKQTDASDQPAASDYKPQSARVPQANAVEAMPMPVPANRGKKAGTAPKKAMPNTSVAAAKPKAHDERSVEEVERAEEEKWARSRGYYGNGYPTSRYYGYGYDRYSYGPYRYRSYGYDAEPVYTTPYRGYSYYGYGRGYYGYGGYGRY